MLTSSSGPLPNSTASPYDQLAGLKKEIKAAETNAVELSKKTVQRTQKIDAKQALYDMRVTAEIKDLLTDLLQTLGYLLDEMEVIPSYGGRDVRRISVARGADTRLLLYIPATVLKSIRNLKEFSLLRYMLPDGALASIISPKLTGFPHQSFSQMVKDWQEKDNIRICFINWDWLKDSAGPEPNPRAFANLFEPSLRAGSIVNTSVDPSRADREYVAGVLAGIANVYSGGSKSYFRNLVDRLDLPEEWAIGDIWTGNHNHDASRLVEIAIHRGRYPAGEQQDYAIFGVLIMTLYAERGDVEMRRRFVRILRQYQLAPPLKVDQAPRLVATDEVTFVAPMPKLPFAERETIVQALAKIAYTYATGPANYYRDLVSRVDLPETWAMSIAGTWTGDAVADARRLVLWAIVRDVNPKDSRYMTLGSLLQAALEDAGLEQRNVIVALIYAYHLYCDDGLLAGLAARYQVPLSATVPTTGNHASPGSPPFKLRESPDEVELQSLLRREPDFLDIGFLSMAIERAASICRVEMIDGQPLGTGFLVGRRKLVTNCHVLESAPGNDVEEKARSLLLRFRSVTATDGKEAEGRTYRPDPDRPLLRFSPVAGLDYALIQIEKSVSQAADMPPVIYTNHRQLRKGMGLNILGHPAGGVMKLAVSGNGIVGVYADIGLVQYATRALSGSSGSPCFDEDWQLVAIHHAERATVFGAVREGILFEPIFNEISSLL